MTARLAESIERLEAMPDFLMGAIERASPAALARRAAPGAFSLREQACHLRDLEREGYLVRVRRMLGERTPELDTFDGAAVAGERDYAAQDARLAAQEFAAARRNLTGMLAPLTAADLARDGIFEGRRITVAGLVDMMLEHDRGHRAEIEALLRGADRWR